MVVYIQTTHTERLMYTYVCHYVIGPDLQCNKYATTMFVGGGSGANALHGNFSTQQVEASTGFT